MLSPLTAFWNKDYNKKFGNSLKKILLDLNADVSKAIQKHGINSKEDAGIFFADDCFVGLRNLGFLSDPLFQRAVGPRAKDKVLMGRIWRLWIISWSLSTRWSSTGAILDLGTYNGKAMFVACKYAALKNPSINLQDKNIILADMFEDPPEEARKSDHGANLNLIVKELFKAFAQSSIIKGKIPESISQICFDQGISWCQIDLNSAEYDLAAFKCIYKYLLPGSHVIFDDYGFSRYRDTQKSLDNFLEKTNERICELPTGQGLFIKS